jgi:phage terminase large subunit-like protein
MRKTCAARLRTVLSDSARAHGLESLLAELSEHELEFLIRDWQVWARDDQLFPSCSVIPGEPPSGETRDPAKVGESGADFLGPGSTHSREGALAPAGMTGFSSRPPGAEHGSSGRLAERESEAPSKNIWLVLGGRGSGKTRAGAEWVRSRACGDDQIDDAPRIALVGKTLGEVRNVMIEGPSGLLAIHARRERPVFEPSKRRLTWPNGAVAEMFSADEREALRGPQFSAAWCDEVAKWREAEKAWDMLQFGLRLGAAPCAVATTTPKASAFLKKLAADAATMTTHLSTADNAGNLAPSFLAEMTRRYAGTALGRQELFGEFVEDLAGALWRRAWIEEARVASAPELRRTVVALDPPVTATVRSDACGIVVAGLGVDGRAYVLDDRSVQGREANVWSKAAIAAYDDYSADRIVAEVNQGGDLVAEMLKQGQRNLPIARVRATRGKWVRAEPVASLYAEGRVAHAGRFEALEDQMCAFGPDGKSGGRSPDRVDALVWALTELMLGGAGEARVRVL